jgi:pyruvate/2-oxoglutarate dehydrogenase complex dihydrolipoamide acyltransferase (E2) component
MATLEFRLPKLGMSVMEAMIVEWMVTEGDDVAEGQPLVLVELDKAETELPSPAAGRVASISVPAGETVDVGTVLLTIES